MADSSPHRNLSIHEPLLSGPDIRKLQSAINRQIDRLGLESLGVSKTEADGRFGHDSLEKAREVGAELGAPDLQLAGPIRPWLQLLIRAPWRIHATDRNTRRRAKEAMALRKKRRETPTGVVFYDGVRVAAVAVPYLNYARGSGIWHGRVTSGHRDPDYSEHLCIEMCGRPACPGKCAGRASNHSGLTPDHFAVDVTDSANFARAMRQMPNPPHGVRIKNNIGPSDVVHFSPSGY